MDLLRLSERLSRLLAQEKVFRFVLLVSVLAYAGLLIERMGAYAGGSDSSGYLNSARLLSRGEFDIERREIPGLPTTSLPDFALVPLGFVPEGEHRMVPTYPIGISLFVVASASVVGWDLAPPLVIVLHALAGIWLMYRLARIAGATRFAAYVAASLLGLSPLYVYFGVQFMSDVPSVTWCLAAVLAAWHSRHGSRWAYAAGLAVTVAVLVRPSNLLIIFPVAIALGVNIGGWIRLAVAGLPGALLLGYYNHRLYGSPFSTGYGPVQKIFGWINVPSSLSTYGTWLPVLLTPAIALSFGFPAARRGGLRLPVSLLLGWILPVVVFYAFYYHTHEAWWYLRFILPTFPAVILLVVFVGARIGSAWPRLGSPLAASVVFTMLVAWYAYWDQRLLVGTVGKNERSYIEAIQWVKNRVPPNAILAIFQTSGAFFYYSDYSFFRYDIIKAADFKLIQRAAFAAQRPIYAALFPFETRLALEQRAPGQWTQIGAVRQISLWRMDGTEATPIIAPNSQELVSRRYGNTNVAARTSTGWFSTENSAWHKWCWSRGPAQVIIDVWPQDDRTVTMSFRLRSLVPREVKITFGDKVVWAGSVGRDHIPVSLSLPPVNGRITLDFTTDQPPQRENDLPSARELAFGLYDPTISLEPAR